MGFDISSHPVDVDLVRNVLLPAVMAGRPADDFIAQAAGRAIVGHRAKRWAMRVQALESAIFDRQLQPGPPDQPPANEAGLWQRLGRLWRGGGGKARPRPRPATGLPGFDSDLSVWGRPFFVTADDAREAIAVTERYMSCTPRDLDRVDQIAAEQFGLLEARRARISPHTAPEAIRALAEFYPLSEHLPPFSEQSSPDIGEIKAGLQSRLDLLRAIWQRRASSDPIDHPLLDEPRQANELAAALPQEVIGLAAQALPGWMGRGHVWPTVLFEKIGVDVSHIFETPAVLFAEMSRELPGIASGFSTTIRDNYSLGGYVRPENVAHLKAALTKHRRDLILAWSTDKTVPESDLDGLATDFRKCLEPVIWAEQRGYGFIEAAEVYSGFMGALN